MDGRLDSAIVAEIDELAYDIRMSLETGLPVSAVNEFKLTALLDELPEDSDALAACAELRELCSYFLDTEDDGRAWNIRNMLIGEPII